MTPALILDANQRSALAATRALGSRGIPVVAADETRATLAGSSKYCAATFTYPSPSLNPEEFIAVLQRESVARGAAVIFPMTDMTSDLLVGHRDAFGGVRIPLGPSGAFHTLADKWELSRLARALEVPVPRTVAVNAPHELPRDYSTFRFPIVVKPRRSRIWVDGRCVAGTVTYASSAEELAAIVARHPYFTRHPFLLQEYIRGEARGVFALYEGGRPRAFFAHRRLRQKPPSGGVSVLSESIEVEPRLRELTRRILDHVGWEGVAMLEFKVSRDGMPYLIEANPRFWGSLQLAIDAGVDFPFLLYQLALGLDPEPITGYMTGVKSRWLLGDLDHLYMVLKGHPGPDLRRGSRWRTIASFLDFFDRTTRYDVGRLGDLRPVLVELRRYLWSAS